MIAYLFIPCVIFYSLWDIKRLNEEIRTRCSEYKNIENIETKPSCRKRKAVLLCAIILAVLWLLTWFSMTIALAVMVICVIVCTFVRKRKIKKIELLDENNTDYWR